MRQEPSSCPNPHKQQQELGKSRVPAAAYEDLDLGRTNGKVFRLTLSRVRPGSEARLPGSQPSAATDWQRDEQVTTLAGLPFLSCEMGGRRDSKNAPPKAGPTPHPACPPMECSGTSVRNRSMWAKLFLEGPATLSS